MVENAGKQPKASQDETNPAQAGSETQAAPAHLFSALPPSAPLQRQQILHMQRTLGNQTTMRWLRHQNAPAQREALMGQGTVQQSSTVPPLSRQSQSRLSPLNSPVSKDETEEQGSDEQTAAPGQITADEPPPDQPTDDQPRAARHRPANETLPLTKIRQMVQRIPASVDPNTPITYDLQVPQPADSLSPQEQKRLDAVQGRMADISDAQAELPPASDAVTDARGAVTEPPQETEAHAGQELTAELGQETQPSLEIEELCTRIRTAIRNRRPPSEESLLESDPAEAAQAAGQELNASLEGEAHRVEGEYDALDQTPTGSPSQTSTPMDSMPDAETSADPNAASAAPDPLDESEVSLQADVGANEQRIEQAGMDSAPAQLIQTGPIAEARAAQTELAAAAQADPQQIMIEQQAAIEAARTDMSDLQARALSALHASRSKTAGTIRTGQTGMVGSEEQMRQQIGEQAQGIFDTAQQRVGELLNNLSQKAMQRWEAGVAQLSTTFEGRLSQVAAWIEERHEGVVGTMTAGWDSVFGYPEWIVEAYDTAEGGFADGVCDLLREISTEVNGIVAACHALIQQGRDDISALLTSLPPELQEWAMTEQARFDEQLTGLSTRAETTRTDFNQHITQKAAETVQSARERIYALRQEAEGLIGRISNAINAFLDDPARFIIEGLLELVGIAPAAFWALIERIRSCMDAIAEDPMTFANNLVSALRTGFEQFFGNIETHLMDGLLQWLFSGLGNMGIQMPKDFSLESVMTFFLQVMGISWTRIREILTQHVGQENIELVEQAWSFITDLIQQGPIGIFNLIRDQLDPQGLLDMIMQEAIDYITGTLVEQVTTRLLAMLNPAGAIIQAIEVIYRVLDWVFNNAAQIFSLVETIVGGIADIVTGNLGGMANAIEQALARILPPVIDFLAGFLGLDDLPERVVDIVRGLQQRVEEILNRIIGWLVTRAKGVMETMTAKEGAKDEEEASSEASDHDTALNPEDEKTLERGKHFIHQEEGKYANANGQINENEADQVAQAAEASPYFSSITVGQAGDHWRYDSVIQRSDKAVEGAPRVVPQYIDLTELMAQEAIAIRTLIEKKLLADSNGRAEDPLSTEKNVAFADYTFQYKEADPIVGTHVSVSGRNVLSTSGMDPDTAYSAIHSDLEKDKWNMLTPETQEAFSQKTMAGTLAPYKYSEPLTNRGHHPFATSAPIGHTNDDHTEPKLEEAITRDILKEITRLARQQFGEQFTSEQEALIKKDFKVNIKMYTEAKPCPSCGGKHLWPELSPLNSLDQLVEWGRDIGLKHITLDVYYTFEDPKERASFYKFFRKTRAIVGQSVPEGLIADLYHTIAPEFHASMWDDPEFYDFLASLYKTMSLQTIFQLYADQEIRADFLRLYDDDDFRQFFEDATKVLEHQTDTRTIIHTYEHTPGFPVLFTSMVYSGVDQNILLALFYNEQTRRFFLTARKCLDVRYDVLIDLYRHRYSLKDDADIRMWAEKWSLEKAQINEIIRFLDIPA